MDKTLSAVGEGMPTGMRVALDALVTRDPRLAVIEAAAGPVPWRVRTPGFAGLLQIVVGQVISAQSAAAIWGRLAALPRALTPAGLLALPPEVLRGVGLSRFKAAHARALAAACLDGRLDLDALPGLDDAAAAAAITVVRGLGPWTAEVYLVFALGRVEVFPAGDVALAGAVAELFGLAERPGPRALRGLAEGWAPCRGLAARLLWHWWRYRTGRPSVDELRGNARAITPPAIS